MMLQFRKFVFALSILLLASCSDTEPSNSETQVATLYRNGALLTDMRLHFGSFDAEGESNDFNISNCEMAARLLNQNVRAQSAESERQTVGFWCEPGDYREDGIPPVSFDAAFPTSVDGKPAP